VGDTAMPGGLHALPRFLVSSANLGFFCDKNLRFLKTDSGDTRSICINEQNQLVQRIHGKSEILEVDSMNLK